MFNFTVDITAQVEARRQVEALNQELHAAQVAAARQQALLQALFEQATVALALFQDEELRVASANPPMAAIWGYPPSKW